MFDIFLLDDVRTLMKEKTIVFLGDSNVRALYKDLLCLLKSSEFILDRTLKTKMENSVFGDKLVFHGKKTNARCYREEREASIDSTNVSFYFLTKVYDDYVKEVLKKITVKSNPDIIVVNSCLWDITRWGCDGVKHFKENLNSLMKEFKVLFPDCLIIWITTPPIACELKGGFLVKELQFLKYSLRFHVVEANHHARKVVVENGFDVLDSHYHLHMQIDRRCNDGIHWLPEAVRYVTNLLLRHISLSWGVPLPHRYEPISADENLLSYEDTGSPVIMEGKEKENVTTHDMTQNYRDKSETNEQGEAKGDKSVPKQKVTRKEESIHSHMAKNSKKARQKRIRQWEKQQGSNNPQTPYNPATPSIWNSSITQPYSGNDQGIFPQNNNYPNVWNHITQPYSTNGLLAYVNNNQPSIWVPNAFNPIAQAYSASVHIAHNLTSNNNHALNPSHSFYYSGSHFTSNGGSSFSGQSILGNYSVPYVFPSVDPRQLLRPNFNFTNDEIPANFKF